MMHLPRAVVPLAPPAHKVNVERSGDADLGDTGAHGLDDLRDALDESRVALGPVVLHEVATLPEA
eukprot:13579045-Alexandrium_andersonii.AAC.1